MMYEERYSLKTESFYLFQIGTNGLEGNGRNLETKESHYELLQANRKP